MRKKYKFNCPYCEKVFLRGRMGYANHRRARHPETLIPTLNPIIAGIGETMVNHPPHYTFGKYEVIDVLEDWFPTDPLLWQVGKYISRAGRKGSKAECLKKARFYLERAISKAEEGEDKA